LAIGYMLQSKSAVGVSRVEEGGGLLGEITVISSHRVNAAGIYAIFPWMYAK
jgi:hypothetical protein